MKGRKQGKFEDLMQKSKVHGKISNLSKKEMQIKALKLKKNETLFINTYDQKKFQKIISKLRRGTVKRELRLPDDNNKTFLEGNEAIC